jgi:deoxyribonuclease IV
MVYASMNPIGAHMSIAGEPAKAFQRIKDVRGECFQIFVKPNVQWQAGELSLEEAAGFIAERERTGIAPIVAHASYLLNLASPEKELRNRSVLTLALELVRSARLEIEYLVLHPGSHREAGEKKEIKWIAQGIDRALAKADVPKTKILLETMAGSGSQLGSRLEHLRDIMDQSRNPKRLGVCLDTCHVFSAGFDLTTVQGYQEFFDGFQKRIGLRQIKCLHANDSKNALGSGVDRHEQLGLGHLGLGTFQRLLHDPRLEGIPFIVETPKGEKEGKNWDVINIRKLKRLRNRFFVRT